MSSSAIVSQNGFSLTPPQTFLVGVRRDRAAGLDFVGDFCDFKGAAFAAGFVVSAAFGFIAFVAGAASTATGFSVAGAFAAGFFAGAALVGAAFAGVAFRAAGAFFGAAFFGAACLGAGLAVPFAFTAGAAAPLDFAAFGLRET